MTYEKFVGEVMGRTGLEKQQAVRAIEGCLRSLAEGMSEMPARRIAAQLPSEIAAYLCRAGPVQTLTEDRFYRQVAEFEGVRLGVGLEHAEVVLQTLYGAMDDEGRSLLRVDLPPALLEIAAARPSYHPPPPRPIPPPKVQRRTSSPTSLAAGRPSSRTPLTVAGLGSHLGSEHDDD